MSYFLKMSEAAKIDNAQLREAFLRSTRTAADVARALGWNGSTGRGDSSRVRRTLGITPDRSTKLGPGYSNHRRTIDAETAARIADAIGVMPWEIGA